LPSSSPNLTSGAGEALGPDNIWKRPGNPDRRSSFWEVSSVIEEYQQRVI